MLQDCQSWFQIYIVELVKISNFGYFHSVIFLYSQIILCLQNTAVSSGSTITWVSTKLLLIIHNKDKQVLRGVQQSSVTCNTETLHEVRFKIVYLHTALKVMEPQLPSLSSAYVNI